MGTILQPAQQLSIAINLGMSTKTVTLDGVDISTRVSAIAIKTSTGQPGFNPGVITVELLTITIDGVVCTVEGPCAITIS